MAAQPQIDGALEVWLSQHSRRAFDEHRKKDQRAQVSIFKVPRTLVEENKKAYIPQTISLGPLHFLKPELAEHEAIKASIAFGIKSEILTDFFQWLDIIREGKETELPPDDLFSRILTLGKESYDSFQEFNKETFTSMMFWDSVYLLSFLRDFSWVDGFRISNLSRQFDFTDIVKDVVKLENQIPLFLLRGLYYRINAAEQGSFDWLVLKKVNYFSPFMVKDGIKALSRIHNNMGNRSHLLECIRDILVGCTLHDVSITCDADTTGSSGTNAKQSYVHVSTAVALNKAGIEFKPFRDGGGIRNIRFHKETSTLHLPAIHVRVLTETVLRNVIAYELCSPACVEKAVRSYAHLMNDLINTEKDVALLRESKILFHDLGSDENMAQLWNTLSNSTSRPPFRPIDDARSAMLEVHERKRYRILWSNFKEDHFLKPWVFVSAVAATLLLLMTVAQTVCLFKHCQT